MYLLSTKEILVSSLLWDNLEMNYKSILSMCSNAISVEIVQEREEALVHFFANL